MRVSIVLLLIGSIPALAQGEGDPTCAVDGTCNDDPTNDAVIPENDQVDLPEEGTEPAESEGLPCLDDHEKCEFWAGLEPSECEKNPNYMLTACRKACKVCVPKENEPEKIELPSIDVDLEFDLGETQSLTGSRAHETRKIVEKTIDYMRNEVLVDPTFKKVKEHCKNRHRECAYWALIGECEKNPSYMTLQCAPSCQTCEKIDYSARCPMDNLEPDAWQKGDLNKMFEKITTAEEFQKYSPQVLSRPEKVSQDESSAKKKTAPREPQKGIFRKLAELFEHNITNPDSDGGEDETEEYNIGPWVVVLDDFISPEECEKLIELGGVEGYERSADVGEEKFDGTFDRDVNDGRTSLNAWCRNDCYKDPMAQNVIEKITNLTGIPEPNSEYLQLLKYDVGNFYKTHHDWIPFQLQRPCGVRILTVFLYLNDVEEGGGTDFPTLHLTVQPKRGRALIWPSVMDQAPNMQDSRTYHQALPVEKGVKYGANAWLHQHDFKTWNEIGC